MKRKRIAPYRVHALDAEGRRTPLDAHGIVVELGGGIEVEIDFAPHPGWAGQLVMMTPARANMTPFYDAGKVDSFEVNCGAANVLHVRVDRRIRKKQRRAASTTKREANARTASPTRRSAR